jgi:trans-aconitate 2-methyltransferase
VSTLVEWAKGAPLRPVSTLLDEESFEQFCSAYSEQLTLHYKNVDGSYTVPFERIFLLVNR